MPIVRIGPTYDSLQPYNVNDDENPFYVNSKHFTGYITVRLQNHHNKDNEVITTNSYFENHRRFFSFQFQGRFKPTNFKRKVDNLWTFDDVFFLAETENFINPPFGASLAVKFASMIDPGFTANDMLLKKRPSAGSWLICGMNIVKVWKSDEEDYKFYEKKHFGKKKSTKQKLNVKNSPLLVPKESWIYYGKNYLDEDTRLILPNEQQLTSAKRRNYFLDPQIRKRFVFDPSLVYAFDFFNNFTNFSTMKADMIVKFSMLKVLRNQPLRFVCRNKEGDAIFFIIEIDYSDLL
nr:8685_t:CDS:2 [Entrophospora candida]